MGRIYRRPVKQKSGLWAAWRQLFNKRIRWRGHNVICQLVSLYKEELGATAWKCHLRTQINLHTCCFGCEGSVTLHQSGTILCKSELPLQTADKPVLRRPQRLFKVEKKKNQSLNEFQANVGTNSIRLLPLCLVSAPEGNIFT